MEKVQSNNFLAIRRAACGNGTPPLTDPDWDVLANWAREQSLTALFYTGASQYAEFLAWDAGKRSQLQRETIATVFSQQTRTQLFLNTYQILRQAGLRPLVLKGLVVRQLYGELADYRPSCDEDLYVPPEHAAQCRCVLEENGWRVTYPETPVESFEPDQELSFDMDDNRLHLELHPNFFELGRKDLRLCNRYFQDALQRAVSIDAAGFQIWTLSETDHYFYLFLHLAKHLKSAGVGIRQIMDLMMFERAHRDQIQWARIHRGIQELHYELLYGAVTAIGMRLGFTPQEIFPSCSPELLLADSLEGGIYGHSSPSRSHGALLIWTAFDGTSGKASILRTLFPPYRYVADNWPLLKKFPWLLPVGWIRRFYRFFVVRRGGGSALSAVQKGKERTVLLQRYGLLPERERSLRR